jgi:hypothetical protein
VAVARSQYCKQRRYENRAAARTSLPWLVETGKPVPCACQQFCRYAPEPNPETKKKVVVCFALNDDRPPFAFAGSWTEFKGDRGTKSKPIPGLTWSMAS